MLSLFRRRAASRRPPYAVGGLLLLLCLLLLPGALQAAESVEVEIKVHGAIGAEALDNVRAAAALPSELGGEGTVDLRWLERFAGRVPARVVAALRPFGYYHAEAVVDLRERDAGGRYRLVVSVEPGPPVRVDRLRLTLEGAGREEAPLARLVREFPLHPGAVLRQDLYEEAKGELVAKAIELGYLDAEIVHPRLLVDPAQNRAEVELTLATGEQYRFGRTLIHGAPDYPDAFLRRYLAYAEGDVFSDKRLGQTQINFLNSDRFRDVIATPIPEQAEERRVPVGIELVPSARRRLRPGVGYGTDTGARLSLRYKDVNIQHLGHELTADFLVAEKRQSLGTAYIIPSRAHLESYTALRAGLEREDIDTYRTETLFTEIEHVHAFAEGQTGSVFLRLLSERYSIGDTDSRANLVLPGLRFTQRRFDDPVRPRSGYQLSLELRGTHPALGSDTDLMQALGSANILLPLGSRMTLLLRGQGGSTWQQDEFESIPPSLRFFAGGDQSVRGYGYQTLGPADASGDVIGGKQLLVGSTELELAVGEDWGAALFWDAGNAFDSFSDYRIHQGAGAGVRRYTPIGPIKFDLARQVGEQDPKWRIHLSVGFGW